VDADSDSIRTSCPHADEWPCEIQIEDERLQLGQMSEFLRGKLEDLLVASDATSSPGCGEADVSRS
jgi:hypothetical protein